MSDYNHPARALLTEDGALAVLDPLSDSIQHGLHRRQVICCGRMEDDLDSHQPNVTRKEQVTITSLFPECSAIKSWSFKSPKTAFAPDRSMP